MDHHPIGHLITAELIRSLRQLFPLRQPHLHQPEREIWMKAGQQDLIDFLEAEHNDAIHQNILSE